MNSNGLAWDALFFQGSVVDLDITTWTARLGIKPSDLGIENTTEVRMALSLGSHRLAPKKSFDSILEIARDAKRVVEWHSINFPFIRGARYIPEKKMEQLMEKLRGLRSDFNAAADEYADRYDEIKAAMIPVIRKALLDAACDNIDASMERILSQYPTRIEVRSKFKLSWNVYAIRGAKSQAAAEAVEQESENVKSVVREMVVQLREEFTEKVAIIAKQVARGARLKGNTISSSREVLARIEEMNLFGDSDLSRQIDALRAVLDRAESMDKSGELAPDLDSIQSALDVSLEEAVANAENYLTGLGRRRIRAAGAGEEV